MPDPVQRRLAAIMFTDIVGYTALMAESEEKGPASGHCRAPEVVARRLASAREAR